MISYSLSLSVRDEFNGPLGSAMPDQRQQPATEEQEADAEEAIELWSPISSQDLPFECLSLE